MSSITAAIKAVQSRLPPVRPVLSTDNDWQLLDLGYCYCICRYCGCANWVHETYLVAARIPESNWACDTCAETTHSISAIPHYDAACQLVAHAEAIHDSL